MAYILKSPSYEGYEAYSRNGIYLGLITFWRGRYCGHPLVYPGDEFLSRNPRVVAIAMEEKLEGKMQPNSSQWR